MLQNVSPIRDSQPNRTSLDEIVEAFEEACSRNADADVAEFIPPKTHCQFRDTALELLCIDLERRWQRGERPSVEEYMRRFPDLLAERSVLEQLAFEEYRQRRSHNASTPPADYADRFSINTSGWPGVDSTHANTSDTSCVGGSSPSETLNSVRVGDSFLGFEIEEELGRGRFGRVFLARQAALANRQVVIKVTTTRWCESDRLARLQHTNVVSIYSVHRHGDLQVVCMPFLGRRTLAHLLHGPRDPSTVSAADPPEPSLDCSDRADGMSVGTLPDAIEKLGHLSSEQLAIWITSQLVAGLAHAHQRGILHRDLKPANILMSDHGQPLILDFNLSDDVIPGGKRSLFMGGTLPYMAPEHLRALVGQGQVDARSDIFSTGVVLFQMLTGQLPYPAGGDASAKSIESLVQQRLSPPPSVRQHRPRVAPAVDAIVERCLAPEPSRRYQTAGELWEDLDRQLRDLPLKHALNRSALERSRKWLRRHPRATLVGACGAVAGAVLSAALWMVAVRGSQVAVFNATEQFRQFQEVANAASLPLSIPDGQRAQRHVALQRAQEALKMYGLDEVDWRRKRAYRSLSSGDREELHAQMQRLLYVVTETMLRQLDGIDDPIARKTALEQALMYNSVLQELSAPAAPAAAFLDQEAQILVAMGRGEEAPAMQWSNDQARPAESRHDYFNALQNVLDRNYSAAGPSLARLQQQDPRDVEIWFLSGICRIGQDRYADAEICLTRCIALQPDAYPAYFHRGVARLGLEKYGDAEADFTKMIDLFPGQADAHFNRALARQKQAKRALAIEDYTAAINCGRDDALPFLLRSKIYDQMNRPELASEDLREGLRRSPIDVDGWIQRGVASSQIDPEQALSDFEEALRLNPSSTQALRNRAILLADVFQRLDEAMATLDRLVQLEPTNPDARAMRGLLRAGAQDRAGAWEDAQATIKASSSARAYFQAACILAQSSRAEPADGREAVKLLAIALQRDIRLRELVKNESNLLPIVNREDLQNLMKSARTLHLTGQVRP